MPFTGDLENLHIVDIIQLLHGTRKSGTFSVMNDKGESRIVFSNGYIVAANHLNNKIRIGTVLVRTGAISEADLKEALEFQKNAGANRKPLVATLIDQGKIDNTQASSALKKLIEITIVELIGWTSGAFAFDTDAISVSSECSYLPGEMDQEFSLDAQMVLMDALRIYDERKRDIDSGQEVKPYEEEFAEALPGEDTIEIDAETKDITADDLGLADVDKLEKKIPKPFSSKELFDPIEIHRQHIKKVLTDFSEQEQEEFVAFLKGSINEKQKRPSRHHDKALALILLSRDELIKYSFMTIYKTEGVLIFSTDDDNEMVHFLDQCVSKGITPVVVYDGPDIAEGGLTEDIITSLRDKVSGIGPDTLQIQFAFPLDYLFMLQSYNAGIKAVFPKPHRDAKKKTFIADTVQFLEAFKYYLKGLLRELDNQGTNSVKLQ
ncbi:MAG: DUF4388 domain-containing protein [Nitrospirota bacterium]|nr:MAG: DUF4388 domain-containing protein [Nitrospirota bacterium]